MSAGLKARQKSRQRTTEEFESSSSASGWRRSNLVELQSKHILPLVTR